MTEIQPDLTDTPQKQALKIVLKWEIQTLLDRLADIGEETLVLTADLEDGNTGQLASERGFNFLSLSDLQDVKTKFLSFCAGCNENSDLGSYRNLPLGELAPQPTSVTQDNYSTKRRSHTSNSRRKKRPKRSHTDIESYSQQLSAEDGGTLVDDMTQAEDELICQTDLERSRQTAAAGSSKSGSASRRKRTPKKMKATSNSDSNTEENVSKPGYCSDDNDITAYQSDETALTGCQLNAQGTHSNSGVSDNQSSGSENSGDHSAKNIIRINSTKSPRKNSCKIKVEKVEQNITLDSDDANCLSIELQTPDSQESENLANLIQSTNCKTPLTEDGGMRIFQDVEVKKEIDELYSEEVDEIAMFSPRPGSKYFKSASGDELPSETALLDAAKLCVGRYQCPWCMLIVRDRHDLKRHLRTHTKEKPYHCELCGRNFSRKWDLENHIRRHQEESMKETMSKVPVTMVDLDEIHLHSMLRKSAKTDETDNEKQTESQNVEAVKDVSLILTADDVKQKNTEDNS